MSTSRVYLDNNLLGPNAGDYVDEALALREIEDGRAAGRWLLEWLVSGRTANELEKAPIARREALAAARSCDVPRPSLADYVTVMGPTDRAPAAGGC